MKRKMKITISALVVMFVAAIAVAIASFSFAGDGDKGDLLDDSELLADASGSVSEKTIIDYIIENSKSIDPDTDKKYHIAEITSSAVPSTLETFVSSNGFKDYVIDGNRTIEDVMADDCVEYKAFDGTLSYKSDTSMTYDDALKYISNADLIYISNDSAKAFDTKNDICEELYSILHEYAVGSFKPLIIDSPDASSIDTNDSKSMNELAKNVFGPNEKYYYAFQWKDGVSAEQYLGHSNSLYLGINGKTQMQNGIWHTVYESQPAFDETGKVTSPNPTYLAKVLTISADGSTERTNQLLQKSDNKNPEFTNPLYEVITNEDTTPGSAEYSKPANATIYSLATDSIMYINGYNNRMEARPTYIENDVVTMDEAATVDFDQYDMVVIEDSCNSLAISQDMYKKFASAMYGKIHIVYSSKMGTASTSTNGTIDDKNQRSTNYLKLMVMVASTDLIAKYDNILVTSRSEFGIITTTTSAKTAKVVADLINKSKYRGMGGSSSSSSMFTVLELQPCYPIDLTVAESQPDISQHLYKGSYYTKPSNMHEGKTKEQLPANSEYYAWELSKAKLSDALGIPYNKINLVQMSTEEFAGDKSAVLGTYDMIYIGGNTSAIKDDPTMYKALENQYLRHNWNNSLNLEEAAKDMPFYTVYSHNGDLVYVTAADNQNLKGSKLTAQVSKDGNLQYTFTTLNGNDITYNRYLALKEYIDKGMPVIVSDKLTRNYIMARDNNYAQNVIDPDSNMYKVLAACDAKKTEADSKNAASSVMFGFLQDKVVDVYADDSLGGSETGYVSVFASQNGSQSDSDTASPKTTVTGSKEMLLQVYNASKKKPKLMIKNMPATYNRFDSDTILTDRTLKFKFDVANSSKYTVNLYIDDDGNGKFSEKEKMISSNTGSLEYTCASSFFGALYWMLEVVDDDTGVSVNQTGFSYIKNSENKKQQVSVLQIMPDDGQGSMGNDSLYFCTVCQRSLNILNYNPHYNEDADRHRVVTEYNEGYKDTPTGYLTNDIYLGKHQHKFGVVAYDSNLKLEQYTGVDDFYSNLADEASAWYDFDIDIIRSSELGQMSQQVRDAFTHVVDDSGNVTDTVVGDQLKRVEIVKGASADSALYADYEATKNEILKAQLESHTTAQKAQDKQDIVARVKADNPGMTDAEIQEKASKLSQTEIINILESKLIDELDADALNAVYVAKKKCDYSDLANTNYLAYTDKSFVEGIAEKKEAVEDAIDALIAGVQAGKGPLAGNVTVKELQDIKKSEYYFDLYALAGRRMMRENISSSYLAAGQDINKIISDYYKETDKELEYKEKYKRFTRYAAGTDWISACYSSVLFGPSESFNKKDIDSEIALDDLETYVKDGHQVVLFHDTLTPYTDVGASKLTARLRSYFGMDRYHMQTTTEAEAEKTDKNIKTNNSNPKIATDEPNYVKYVTKNGYSKDKYFMTNLSNKSKTDESRYKSWKQDVHINAGGYLTDVAYTDSFNLGDNNNNANYAMPYKYGQLSYSDQTVHIQDAKFDTESFSDGRYGTNKASRNNMGLVTTFPFTIASELYIGPTHGQSYAVDLEDDDMTVWYSLAGGDSAPKGSSMYAASPRDAMDNYFLYSYKNVFYCGAGHGDILGIHKNNNDERYLFINIMCNSVRLSVAQPTIKVFDYDPTETQENNSIIKPDGNNGYVMKVKENEDYPEFNFKVQTDSDTTLTNVKIFYDLDYKNGNTSNAYVKNKDHILVADWGSDQVTKGQNKHVFRYNPKLEKLYGSDNHQIMEIYTDENGKETKVAATALKALPSYFAPYNNEYTYIVIEATDSKGNKVYQRIKIKAVPHLFDLT